MEKLRLWFVSLSKSKKVFFVFLVVIALTIIFYLVQTITAQIVLARRISEIRQMTTEALQREKNIKDLLRSDNFGGKTPQETKDLFVKALRNNDFDLAIKYFIVYPQKNHDALVEGFRKQADAGKLNWVADIIDSMEYDDQSSGEQTAWYATYGKDGMQEYTLRIVKNNFSNLWKIEAL